MAALDDLKSAVENETSVVKSAVTLINGFADRIEAVKGNETAIEQEVAQMRHNADALGAAVQANTPNVGSGSADPAAKPANPPNRQPAADRPRTVVENTKGAVPVKVAAPFHLPKEIEMSDEKVAQAAAAAQDGRKLAFERKEDYKGYNIKAWYTPEPNGGDADIEIFKDGKIVKTFKYAAYKIWNLAAHFEDIVESEIANNADGYRMAGSDGLGGTIMPQEVKAL